MRLPEPEPLEDVLLRLEEIYASDRNGQSPHVNGNGVKAYPIPDGLDDAMLPIIVAVCLLPRNEPDDFARLFRYFADHSTCHKHITPPVLALRLRAALFKTTPLVGVVLVSNALQAMQEEILQHPQSAEILAALPKESTKRTKTPEEDAKAGWAFFWAIYQKQASRIIERIGLTCPDLAENIVESLYGSNLSRTDVLSWRETVLIEYVGCMSLDCPAQAKGHFIGCKRLEVGKLNVKKATEVIRQIGEWIGQPLDESRMPFLETLDNWED